MDAQDKKEYWDYIEGLRMKTNPIIPLWEMVDAEKDAQKRKRLELAIKLVNSGMSKRVAARTAHVSEDRLRRELKEIAG